MAHYLSCILDDLLEGLCRPDGETTNSVMWVALSYLLRLPAPKTKGFKEATKAMGVSNLPCRKSAGFPPGYIIRKFHTLWQVSYMLRIEYIQS